GRYLLHVAGGNEFDRFLAARLPARFRPVSLADAWERLGESRRSDELFAGIWARAPEIDADGDDLPELPTSALALLASPQSSGDRARRGDWALVEEVKRPADGVVRGEVLLELVVDRQAPGAPRQLAWGRGWGGRGSGGGGWPWRWAAHGSRRVARARPTRSGGPATRRPTRRAPSRAACSWIPTACCARARR